MKKSLYLTCLCLILSILVYNPLPVYAMESGEDGGVSGNEAEEVTEYQNYTDGDMNDVNQTFFTSEEYLTEDDEPQYPEANFDAEITEEPPKKENTIWRSVRPLIGFLLIAAVVYFAIKKLRPRPDED